MMAECFDCGAEFDSKSWSVAHLPNCPQAPKKHGKINPGASGADFRGQSQSRDDGKMVFLANWRIVYPDLYQSNILQPVYDPEYRFALSIGRNYAFDFAWVEYKIAAEWDGGNRLVKYDRNGIPRAVGRHTQDSDYEKLNIANMLGWHVFRFTPSMFTSDPVTCCGMVYRLLKEKQE